MRGTSGAGKTHLLRRLMADTGCVPVRYRDDKRGKPLVYQGLCRGTRVFVLGSYATVCGGCDTIPTQDEICALVREYAPQGSVVLEGLLMSHLYSRYVTLATEVRPFVFAFLDTPLEVCLDRIAARRRARGDERPLNPTNTIGKYNSILACHEKFRAAGLACVTLPWQDPWPSLRALL